MLDEIHAKNAHMIITIWSSFGPQTKPYKELNEKDYCLILGLGLLQALIRGLLGKTICRA